MCSPRPNPTIAPTITTSSSASTNKSMKRVSFTSASPQVHQVERLSLSFYQSSDFQRFREDLLDEKYATQVVAKQQEKRQRGYRMMGARRTARLGATTKQCGSNTTMRSHLSSHALQTTQ